LDSQLRKLIPFSLAPLADRSGELALRFAQCFGGRRVFIPKTINARSALATALGMEGAQLVINALGGGADFTVPLCTRALCYQRNLRIEQRALAGASVNELAAEFGLHEVTIRRNLAKMRNRRTVKVISHRGSE